MASQRRAPTKRPPRPAAKKPPPPNSEGKDAAESAAAKTSTAGGASARPAPAKSTKSVKPVPPVKEAAASPSGRDTKTVAPGSPTAKTPWSGPPKTAGTAKAAGAPAGSGPKPSPSGPTYRPPTGAPRSSARRPPPPPRRKKRSFTTKSIIAIVALPLVASLVIFFALAVNGSSTNTPSINAALSGPEQVPIPGGAVLGAVDTARYPQTIDGIQCQASEQVVYHIHAHLAIFVNGQPRVVPYGIGIAPPLQYNNTSTGTFVNGGSCFYWLHTHAADGIMHIESPTQTTYNLGQFFDVWGQPLNSGQVGTIKGKVTVFVDGKPYAGDPRLIPLATHTQIQLDVGTPAPAPTTVTFPSGL